MRNDEFYLDPTRMTLVCGTAAFDGTQFKGLLASEYDIQLNKTSRNSVLLQSNINNTRSDVAHLIRVLVAIARGIEKRLAAGGEAERAAFDARVKSLMTDVPDLPNFSHFHEAFRSEAGTSTPEGDIRAAFFSAYDASLCEYVPLFGAECDRRLRDGPDMVSANFVIPYPPGFPIMVPGQVLTQESIDFMRQLDVKEIHGYEKAKGLKLLKPDAIMTQPTRPRSAPRVNVRGSARRVDAREPHRRLAWGWDRGAPSLRRGGDHVRMVCGHASSVPGDRDLSLLGLRLLRRLLHLQRSGPWSGDCDANRRGDHRPA